MSTIVNLDPLIVEFLIEYANSIEFKHRDPLEICKMLCENYLYNDDLTGENFIKVAFGWMWGRTPGPLGCVDASIRADILKTYLDNLYKSEKNGW